MAFFGNIIKALGFGSDVEDDVVEVVPTPTEQSPAHTVERNAVVQDRVMPATSSAPRQTVESPELVHLIFDHVVAVTNEAIPAYLSNAVDVEKQKQYLYDTLSESIKQYIAALEQDANDKCVAKFQAERDQLRREADSLKQKAKNLESRRAELKENVLSAERQKRALSERVIDLEAKVANLAAEKEQLELEKQSLLNKIKVANLQQSQQISSTKPDQKLTAENDKLRKQVEELQNQITTLNEASEAANVKDAMNVAMLNDLQHKASESLKASQDAQSSIDELNAQLALRDAKISDLNKQISERDAQIAELESVIEEMQVIAEQLDQFQDIKKKMEDTIRGLKSDLRNAQHDSEMLKSVLNSNLQEHALKERALKDRIEQLMAQSKA